MKKKVILGLVFVFLVFSLVSFISAAEVSYCCEKTKSGAFCQNAPQTECDSSFRMTPASCEATSYCQKGFCYDDKEGTCAENTPEKLCELNGGGWEQDNGKTPVQCQLGCCLIGDQAAYVTQTRCKKLSAVYGLQTDFRSNVNDEKSCIALAHPSEEGACVFGSVDKTCKRTTKEECDKIGSGNSSAVFHAGFLCSAQELGANCGKTQQTVCVDGKDEVYFVDSCGNLANIYDSSKVDDNLYWSKIVSKSESCGAGGNNANSASCGNCNYFYGSICKKAGSKDTVPRVGDNICKDLSCTFQGQKKQHGETWCASSEDNKVGSRDYRYICFNGEVQVEPCADFRQQICMQTTVNGYSSAACVTNKWQDCYSQKDKMSCENSDRRDCKWIKGVAPLGDPNRGTSKKKDGACVPANSPGLNFWSDGDAQQICSLGNAVCIVTFSQGVIGGKTATTNAECLDKSWVEDMNKVCMALGDCGSKVNWIDQKGYGNGYIVGTKKNDSSGVSGTTTTQQPARFNTNTPTPTTPATTTPTTTVPATTTPPQQFGPSSGTIKAVMGWIVKVFGINS